MLKSVAGPGLEQAIGSHAGPAKNVLGAIAGGQNITSAVQGVAAGALEQSTKGAFGRARELGKLGKELKHGGLLGTLGSLAEGAIAAQGPPVQGGGARAEPLSTEAKVFGATTLALIGGGAIKYFIDSINKE
jgi:hypothetical protein